MAQWLDDRGELDMLLEPYLETPQQFADRRRSGSFEPERRLYAAAFTSHIYDCLSVPKIAGKGEKARERYHHGALAWLMSDSEADLSFRWYCELLGIDAKSIRRRVLKGDLRKRERAEPR